MHALPLLVAGGCQHSLTKGHITLTSASVVHVIFFCLLLVRMPINGFQAHMANPEGSHLDVFNLTCARILLLHKMAFIGSED